MADRFKPPSMDWTSPGDVHSRFKMFKQKCELIFDSHCMARMKIRSDYSYYGLEIKALRSTILLHLQLKQPSSSSHQYLKS